jgi:hypothetical protein
MDWRAKGWNQKISSGAGSKNSSKPTFTYLATVALTAVVRAPVWERNRRRGPRRVQFFVAVNQALVPV